VTQFWQYDHRYGWSHIPNSTGIFHSLGFDVKVTINSKGFRGTEYDYERIGNKRRVLVLGDSFVWGFGVELVDMFTTQLEELIPNVEIINLSVSGYSTDQELLLYQDEGRKYRPDLVVLVVAVNDLSGNMQTTEYAIYGKPAFILGENGDLDPINQPVHETPWIKRTVVKLAWHSYLLTQLNRILTEKETHQVLSVKRESGKKFPRSLADELTARLLIELKNTTASDGTELLVVLVNGFAKPKEIVEYLAKYDVDALPLDDYIDFNDKALHLPDGFHWSPDSHKTVANVLAGELKKRLTKVR
jgi:lysophospholipase L1-like esterase